MKLREMNKSQIEKAMSYKTGEEMMSFLAKEGIELTPEELELAQGGGFVDWFKEAFEEVLRTIAAPVQKTD